MRRNSNVLFGLIDNGGKLTFDDSAAFAKVRASLRGQAVQIEISPRRKKRSLAENSYYWGVVIPLLCDWSGFSAEEMHDAIKNKFLFGYDKRHGLARIGSTATLSTVEFEQLMSEIRMWASDQGVFIPEPNEEIY